MTNIRLVATRESQEEVNRLAQFFERLARGPGAREREKVADAIRRGFQENFTRQRAGDGAPWAPLAPATVRQRRAWGFAGRRPILVRTGRYRASFVSRYGDAHYSSFQASGRRWVWEEGSVSYLAPWHELGTSRMPARPVTPLSRRSEDRIGNTLDLIFEQISPK